jgi:hypothetical protein
MLLALVALGCAEEPMLDTYEVSGRVTVLLEGGGTGDPISAAQVTFASDTGIEVETATDGDGRYRMRVRSDHRFGQVRATAAGFIPAEETVYFDTPQRRVDLAMRRQPGG